MKNIILIISLLFTNFIFAQLPSSKIPISISSSVMSNVSTTKSTTTVIVSTTMVVSPNVSSSAQTEIVVSTTGDQWFDHYHNRIAYFKKENIEIDIKSNKEQKWAKQIVLLGDSLTEGFNIKKFFPDLPVVNRGIVSDHTVWGGTKYEGMGVLYRITPLLLAPNPSHIFLLIGTNDVGGSLDVCEKNYREILKMLKENFPEAKVVIQTLPPTRGRYARLNDAIREFNERLKNLAKEFKLDLIDLHSLFVDENGELKENFTRDGLHLTEPAYEIWKTEIEKVLKMK